MDVSFLYINDNNTDDYVKDFNHPSDVTGNAIALECIYEVIINSSQKPKFSQYIWPQYYCLYETKCEFEKKQYKYLLSY